MLLKEVEIFRNIPFHTIGTDLCAFNIGKVGKG